MGKKILGLNIFYYCTTLFFLGLTQEDASSSLGYGFFIIIFWIAWVLLLIFLIIKKSIQPKSIAEKIGIFTSTPILSILAILIMFVVKENVGSVQYFYKEDFCYKIRKIYYKKEPNIKRIEFYRKKNSDLPKNNEWLRDSVWVFFGENGDTLKKIKYKNGKEVNVQTN